MTNVALVVLDTLRKDAFDEHFDWLPGTRYENAWTPGAWTVPAHGALFGGQYPSEVGVYAKAQSLTCEKPVLAESLSGAGYTTRGFSANANISDAFDFTRGFDEFDHSWRGKRRDEDVLDWGRFIDETRNQGVSRYAEAMYECFTSENDTIKSLQLGAKLKARDLGIEWLSGRDDGARKSLEMIRGMEFGNREFLFLNLMEAHSPYNAPSDYRTVDIETQPSFEDTVYDGPDERPEDIRQAYDDCVAYLSDTYQNIYAELKDDFDYIITVSDHGEMFGTDGIWDHHHGIYPELTHIPICISGESVEDTQRAETVNLLDVHRTILDIADCDDVPSRGENLLTNPTSRDHLVERYGLRTSRVNAVEKMENSTEILERYDTHLKGVVLSAGDYMWETPDQRKATGDIEIADAVDKLDLLVNELDEADVTIGEDSEIPADVESRLKDLGYV